MKSSVATSRQLFGELLPAFKPKYNIAPSSNILVVRQDEVLGRVADLYRWGLIPGWARDLTLETSSPMLGAKRSRRKPMYQVNGKAWKGALDRAGIAQFRWHDLRHTWAKWHVLSGTTLHELKELGGCIRVTLIQVVKALPLPSR